MLAPEAQSPHPAGKRLWKILTCYLEDPHHSEVRARPVHVGGGEVTQGAGHSASWKNLQKSHQMWEALRAAGQGVWN